MSPTPRGGLRARPAIRLGPRFLITEKGFAHPEPPEPLNEPFIATGVGAVCWRVLLPRSNSVLKSWIKASESSASKGFVRYCSRRQANEHG